MKRKMATGEVKPANDSFRVLIPDPIQNEGLTAVVLLVGAKLFFRDRLVGLLAASLYLVFMPLLPYGLTMGSEPLAMLLCSVAFIGVMQCARSASIKSFVVLGIVMGLLVLTRPTFLIFPRVVSVVFLIFAAADRRRVRIVVPLALSLLTLTPWVARNYSVFGEPVFSTGLGYNLYRHNSSIIDEAFHHEGYPPHVTVLERIAPVLDEKSVTIEDMNELEFDRFFRTEALAFILDNKWAFINLAAKKSIWLFSLVRTEFRPDILLLSVALIGAAGLGIWRYARTDGTDGALVSVTMLLLFGSWIGIHAILVSQYRYFVPFIPILLLFASNAVMWHVRRLLDRPPVQGPLPYAERWRKARQREAYETMLD